MAAPGLVLAVFRVVPVVQPRAELLAGLEEGHMLGFDRHRIAGAGIATGARLALAHGKRAETTQLHAVAAFQRGSDLVEDDIDDLFHLTHFKRGVFLGEALDEFGTQHAGKFALSDTKDKSFSPSLDRVSCDSHSHSSVFPL